MLSLTRAVPFFLMACVAAITLSLTGCTPTVEGVPVSDGLKVITVPLDDASIAAIDYDVEVIMDDLTDERTPFDIKRAPYLDGLQVSGGLLTPDNTGLDIQFDAVARQGNCSLSFTDAVGKRGYFGFVIMMAHDTKSTLVSNALVESAQQYIDTQLSYCFENL